MSRSKRTRAFLLASAILATAPMYTHGQTSGSWTFNGSGNWSLASNWNPNVPDGGGNALFYQNANQQLGPLVTLDVPITLATLTFDSVYQYQIVVAGTNVLTLNGAATVAVPRSNASTPSLFAAGHLISRPIVGTNGLTKTGGGIVTLTATNTYSGGTNINGGVLRVTVGDVALGAVGAGNDVNFNNASMRASVTALTSARNWNMVGNGTFEAFAATTLTGGVNGSGNFTKAVSSLLSLNGTNTLSGSLNMVNLGSGSIDFAAGGNALNVSAVNSNGSISFQNVATNNTNRLSDTAPITLSGGGMNMVGNATATSSETIGQVTTDAGMTNMTVVVGTGQNTSLTAAGWTRSNRSSVVFRGAGLGGTPGAGVTNIFLTSAPTLVGGGGAAGSTNISIMPGAAADVAAGTGANFATYGANGVRALLTTEYNANITGAAATDNVRKTATEAVAGPVTVNALNMATTAGVTGAGPITITSGQLINSAITSTAHTVPIDFGAAEGHMHMSSSGSFTGVISGSGGLTKSGVNALRLGNANTYTGDTVINAGAVHLTGNVPANAPSAFGNSNDPIILQSGSSQAALLANGATITFDRNIIVRGNGTTPSRLGTVGSTEQTTWNGTIQLNAPMQPFPPTTTVPMIFNGVISGPSRIADTSLSGLYQVNGNNTYAGGTEMSVGSTWDLGHNNALGTGTVWLGSATAPTLRAFGGARVIPNNFQFSGGGMSTAGTNPIEFTGGMLFNAGAGAAPWTVTVALTSPTTFSGVVQDGGLIKAGLGTLRLTGANTYSSGTGVNAGTLDVSNTTGSGTGTGTVNVASGATLAGTGTIAGTVNVANGGIMSPGNTPGTLTEGATVFNSTSSLVWELDAPGIEGGGVNDLLNITGNLTLDGNLSVTQLGGFAAGTYVLMNYSGTLTDNTLNPPTLTGGFTATVDTTSQPGKVLLNVVPEPATLGVLGIAAAGLIARRRRRA